jgi:hypothetical protein
VNCADVIAFVIEPGSPPDEARKHLESCEACRAHLAESRRVALLLTELPATPTPDVAAKVMARIGYGNGRPTRDKILDQLLRVREELDVVMAETREDELSWRPSQREPTISELASHLPGTETTLVLDAEAAMPASGEQSALVTRAMPAAGARPEFSTNGNGHAHTIGTKGEPTQEDLRRVRERTLRLVCGLSASDLSPAVAELLRNVYRHEADHAAQMADTLWRSRRRAALG